MRGRPVPDPDSAPFWEHAAAGRLAVQRCLACGRHQHPPGPRCRRCGGGRLEFEPVAGRGHVHTYTVVHHPPVEGEQMPYVVAVVELDHPPGIRMLGNLLGIDPGEVRVGMAVGVRFEELPGGPRLPQFGPA